ncbi:DeoR/GlpR family DNA-binding transcription regulator [Paenibacillus motobuensis]|uniref:DeoR/GlpR family DNA-binding transcription regulator n=1 Tax=Paenibacillus motobuensis TaxID=295324 RepID=A0ABP3HLE0_9BACL
MKAFERKEKIIQELHRHKKVLVTQLAASFEVTEETIRRDLEKLEQEGVVTRNYGGAVLNAHIHDDLPYQTRNTRNIEEKRAIASLLLPMINDEDTLMTDTSSTVFEALKLLESERDNLTIITNSIIILNEFNQTSHTIISTGGSLRPKASSLIGPVARQTIQNYNVDIALFSCKGISMMSGITDSNEPESELKQAMSQQARQTILLIDSSKFDHIGFVKMLEFKQISYIITDRRPSDEWISFLENKDITLLHL